MTIEEFMKAYGLKNRKTVLKWLENGYVPGAVNADGAWSIPERAWPPYMKRRAKTSTSIYVSLIEACIKRRSVCAKLYRISEEEFNGYIDELVKAELIRVDEQDGVRYYSATTKSDAFVNDRRGLEKAVKKLEPILQPLASALVTAGVQAAATAITGGA